MIHLNFITQCFILVQKKFISPLKLNNFFNFDNTLKIFAFWINCFDIKIYLFLMKFNNLILEAKMIPKFFYLLQLSLLRNFFLFLNLFVCSVFILILLYLLNFYFIVNKFSFLLSLLISFSKHPCQLNLN